MTSGTRNGSGATGVDEQSSQLRRRAVRYGTAAVLACGSVALVAALLPFTEIATYTPLLGAVAISVWFGGLGPGLLAIAIGWSSALFLVAEPRYGFSVSSREEAARWAIALLVALVITWVAWVMQRGRERATTAAGEAEQARARVEQLQAIASALSAAPTPEEVARTLAGQSGAALGAQGAAVGMIEGESLRILEPVGAARGAITEEGLVPLTSQMVLAAAARESRLRWANDHDELARAYPDSARRLPGPATMLAAPLVVRGTTVGSLGFVFAEPGRATDENRSLALLVAQLGGQALERAMLFAEERESRARLEQIVAVAPRVRAGQTPEEVVVDVCRSAREALGADVAHLWTVQEDGFEVVHREPPLPELPAGTVLPASNFSLLPRAVAELRAGFVPDVPATLSGAASEAANAAGTRSALRIPIVAAGEADRLLVLEWERDLPEPSPAFVALARRFADQAGLALDHAERRRLQEVAVRRADDTRQLLDLTAALAAATTLEEVSDTILERCEHDFGAAAGVVGRVIEHGGEFEVIRAVGFENDLLERWRRFPLHAEVPLADAIRRNEVVALASREERDRLYPALADEPIAEGRGSWLAIPLPFAGRAIGGVALSFAGSRRFTPGELDLVGALARQAGQAFERARALESEQQARARAERMAGGLAQLHALATSLSGALSPLEVAVAASAQVAAVLDSSSVGVYVLDGADELELLGGVGELRPGEERPRVPLDARDPLSDSIRAGAPLWLDSEHEWAPYGDHSDGARPLGVVPLFAEGRPIGALVAALPAGRSVDAEQRRFVETVGRQVATPLDRARLLERGARNAAAHRTPPGAHCGTLGCAHGRRSRQCLPGAGRRRPGSRCIRDRRAGRARESPACDPLERLQGPDRERG